MSIQHVDSSVKCQHAIQINCGLEVKIWITRTSEQQPAMCFQLPPPSMRHICSNVIWQTIMTKSLCSQSNGDHKPFWSFICTDSALLFSLSTHIWAVLWKAEAFFFRNLLSCVHLPPSPRRTASIRPTPGLREKQEACAHSCMKPVCCSPLLWFHACYLTMEPVTPDNKAATWGNNAGFSGFRCPLRRLLGVHSPPPISDTVTGWSEKRDTVKPNFLQIKSN